MIIDKASRNLTETIQQNTPDKLKSIIHGVLGVKLSDELAIEVIVVNYVIDDDPANYETETAKWSKLENIKTSCHSGNSLLGPEVYLYLINSMRNITISPESFHLGPFQVGNSYYFLNILMYREARLIQSNAIIRHFFGPNFLNTI